MNAQTSVLIVDDEPSVRELMARWAASLGMDPHTAADAQEALDTLRTAHYDLAVIDVMMPGRDGLWLATQLQRDHPQVAVVIATGYASLLAGAAPPVADCLVKPFQRDRFALAVDRGRQWRKHLLDELHWNAQLAIELEDRTAGMIAELRELQRTLDVDGLLQWAMGRLPETVAHSERVGRYSCSIARELGLVPELRPGLEVAARLHDIGKGAIPEALLAKPSPLTPGEMAVVRRHVDVGADILAAVPALSEAAPLVAATHEWYSGHGYPNGLAGDAIPIESRIIAVADAYDAMTQDRAYRARVDSADAIAELLRCAPAQFDPAVVDAFLAVLGRH